MNRNRPLAFKHHSNKSFSEREAFESLWTRCLNIINGMKFEYFSYCFQYPTPFTNPKNYIYENYQFDRTLCTTKNTHAVITGKLKIKPDHSTGWPSEKEHIKKQPEKPSDSMFYIAYSNPQPEGAMELLILGRRHFKLNHIELRALEKNIKLIAKDIHDTLLNLNKISAPTAHLSPREKEVLRWGADGKTSEETAKILGVSLDTINFHYKTIKSKTHTTNKAQAIAHAIIKGHI